MEGTGRNSNEWERYGVGREGAKRSRRRERYRNSKYHVRIRSDTLDEESVGHFPPDISPPGPFPLRFSTM